MTCAYIAGHDDDCIAEIDGATQCVCQTTIIHHLQQQVKHIRMGFLNLIEQDDGVGLATHFLCEHATFFIAYISRRSTYQSADGELLHVFAHVDANQGIGRTKHVLS